LIWFLAWTCGVAIFQAIWRRRFDRALHAVETPERDLALVCALISRVEAERFGSPRLIALRAAFGADGTLASRRIAQLRRLVSWVDATHSMMIAPIAYLLLVKPQLAVVIDRWHIKMAPPSAVAPRHQRNQALARSRRRLRASVGSFPELTADGPVFDGKRRPSMIADDRSVRNDVRLGGRRSARILVSGSNMSGRARSCGQSGSIRCWPRGRTGASPGFVCPLVQGHAAHQRLAPDGHSRFYAEILRLRGSWTSTRPCPAAVSPG
jgi:hypothetical protein